MAYSHAFDYNASIISEQYFEKHMSIRQIAADSFGRYNRSYVWYVLNKIAPDELRKEGARRRNAQKKHFDDRELYRMYRNGMSFKAIGLKIHASASTVRSHILSYQNTHKVVPVVGAKNSNNRKKW